MIFLAAIWVLALFFLACSLYTTVRISFTLGTALLWAATLLLFAYAIFHAPIHAFCSHGVGRVLKYLFGAGALFMAGMFAFVSLSGYVGGVKGDEKAIIVLGAGLRGEQVTDLLRRRLDTAYNAWLQNPEALLVVTGGQGPRETIPEAHAMQRYLLAKGVPAQKIIVEDKSTSTEENLTFARNLLQQAGISPQQPVAVVTNAFHCYRAGRYAERVGFSTVRTLPAGISITAVPQSYLREIFAILYFWVFKH